MTVRLTWRRTEGPPPWPGDATRAPLTYDRDRPWRCRQPRDGFTRTTRQIQGTLVTVLVLGGLLTALGLSEGRWPPAHPGLTPPVTRRWAGHEGQGVQGAPRASTEERGKLKPEAAVTHLLRDLLTDPDLLMVPLEPRPAVEWEAQEWCLECEQYVPELIYGFCLPCLEGEDPEDALSP